MLDSVSRLSRFTESDTVPLLFHTVRNMQFEQLSGIVERRFRHLLIPPLPVDTDRWYDWKVPDEPAMAPAPIIRNTDIYRRSLTDSSRRDYRERATNAKRGTVTFLNRDIDVSKTDGIRWFPPESRDLPGLWALKFHGFEFLSWASLGYGSPKNCPEVVETFTRWLEDWDRTSETRIGTEGYLRQAWTPHAVSLRVVNLARFCAWAQDDRVDQLTARIAYRNAAFLSNHVEYDVGGNHLIENGIALLIGGALFEKSAWLRQGLDVLVDASDQFLADGGHFERSPMYHIITVTRYLTAIDLLERKGQTIPSPIREVAHSGARFLSRLRPPDGRIPLLNDAAFGEGMELNAALSYADAISINTDEFKRDSLPDSGYYWLGSKKDCMLVDGGAAGPAHLPGHTHNDPFAVYFWADNKRLLTDTGTYEYAPTEKRQHARSVGAHNTVQYGDVEPVPIGGSYLMGRRLDTTVRTGVIGDLSCFNGSYSRPGTEENRYDHRRQIFHGDEWWLVWDMINAKTPAPVTSRLHVAPNIEVGYIDDNRLHFCSSQPGEEAGDCLATLIPIDTERVTVSTSQYFPEFLRATKRPEIMMTASGSSLGIGFLVSTGGHQTATVERDGIDITGVSIDSTYTQLSKMD